MKKFFIKQTKWDNWYGYEGRRKVIEFADMPTISAENAAKEWLRNKEFEQLKGEK